MSPTYMPLRDSDLDEVNKSNISDPPRGGKPYTKPWTFSAVLLLLAINVIIILYIKTPRPEHTPPDYGTEMSIRKENNRVS